MPNPVLSAVSSMVDITILSVSKLRKPTETQEDNKVQKAEYQYSLAIRRLGRVREGIAGNIKRDGKDKPIWHFPSQCEVGGFFQKTHS